MKLGFSYRSKKTFVSNTSTGFFTILVVKAVFFPHGFLHNITCQAVSSLGLTAIFIKIDPIINKIKHTPHTGSAYMADIITIACVTVVNVKSSLWKLLEMSTSSCWPLLFPHVWCCLSLSAVTSINKDFIEGHKSFLPSETSQHKFQYSCETLHPICTHPHSHRHFFQRMITWLAVFLSSHHAKPLTYLILSSKDTAKWHLLLLLYAGTAHEGRIDACWSHTWLHKSTFLYDPLLLFSQHKPENRRRGLMTAEQGLQYALFTSVEICKFKLQPLSIVPTSKGKACIVIVILQSFRGIKRC